MKKAYFIILLIILFSFASGIYFYPLLPDQVASHWNAQGDVDGYMSKFWGAFLMPIIAVGLFLLFYLIPKIDPLKKNIEKFRKYFDIFIVLLFLFLLYMHFLTILWNTGSRFNMGLIMIPALAIIFFYAGVLMQKAERNWFIGIRTPWTLSSDKVWEKTHKLGSVLFKIAAVVSLIGMFFSDCAFWFVLIPALVFSFYTFIYSYLVYRKENKK